MPEIIDYRTGYRYYAVGQMQKVYGPHGRLNENLRKVLEWIASNGYVITSLPSYSYVDGIWNQEYPEKWLTIIQVPVEKA